MSWEQYRSIMERYAIKTDDMATEDAYFLATHMPFAQLEVYLGGRTSSSPKLFSEDEVFLFNMLPNFLITERNVTENPINRKRDTVRKERSNIESLFQKLYQTFKNGEQNSTIMNNLLDMNQKNLDLLVYLKEE